MSEQNISTEESPLPPAAFPEQDVTAETAGTAPVPTAEPDPLPEPPPRLPGAALREAREAAGMTVFEVAQFLKFSPRQIEALEADEYAVLPPGATFLRGFVRGYAKLLKVDPLPLLGMLDNRVPVTIPDVREPQNMGVAETPVTANHRSSKPMVAGAALLASLALALGAWHFLATPKSPAGAPAAAVDKGEPAVRPPDLAVVDAPAAAAEPGAAAATIAKPAETRQLVFAFQDKSWVEVTDASGQIILSGENGAGARQAVSGKPPFQVVIGNAPKVELQYDERQIDLKPYTRADVARLTLE